MQHKDNIFRLIRNCLGLSIKEMAKRCGISTVYYSELERGIKTNPSNETMHGIANACGIAVNSLRILMTIDTTSIRKQLINSLESIAENN